MNVVFTFICCMLRKYIWTIGFIVSLVYIIKGGNANPEDALQDQQGQTPVFNGHPYPLPNFPSSPNGIVKPNEEALKMDNPLPVETPVLTQPEASAATTLLSEQGSAQTPSVSAELINLLKNAITEEQRSLSNLREDISTLQNELKSIREDTKAKAASAQKEGLPDTLTLALEFPNKRAQNKFVEGVEKTPLGKEPAGSEETKGTMEDKSKNGFEAKPKPQLKPLTMKMKPIPIIFAKEDARNDIAQAVKDALETEQYEADYTEQELNTLVEKGQDMSKENKIDIIQTALAKVAARRKYFEEDSVMAKSRLIPGME